MFTANTLTRWDSRPEQRIEIDIGGTDGTYHYSVELLHDIIRQSTALRREVVRYTPGDASKFSGTPSLFPRTVFQYKDGTVQLYDGEG
ncbi:MAG: hypothetical protein ACREDR_47480, partial [Blastocatellia bacterium]